MQSSAGRRQAREALANHATTDATVGALVQDPAATTIKRQWRSMGLPGWGCLMARELRARRALYGAARQTALLRRRSHSSPSMPFFLLSMASFSFLRAVAASCITSFTTFTLIFSPSH